jgi:hypothetical protein
LRGKEELFSLLSSKGDVIKNAGYTALLIII